MQVRYRKTIIPLVIYASLMFAFAFAMAPLYDKFCQVTGLKDSGARKTIEYYARDINRTIRVELDSTLNQNLAFEFYPMTKVVEVNPGETKQVDYYVKNKTNKDVIVQAIPSVTPVLATTHLNKIECFCFTQQTLKAGEEKLMPLIFYLDDKLPKDINTVTLSYTFMNIQRDNLQKDLKESKIELEKHI
jgi:cytochrome c oxidase assembly protein subunit 11